MATVKNVIGDELRSAVAQIVHRLTVIPQASCACGKPIVFVDGCKTFNCKRCGARYVLVVTIKQTKKPNQS